MSHEGFNRKPNKKEQFYCLNALNNRDNHSIDNTACNAIERIINDITDTTIGTYDHNLLTQALNHDLSRIKNCQDGCLAIRYARKMSIPPPDQLDCVYAKHYVHQIINGEISREKIIEDEVD